MCYFGSTSLRVLALSFARLSRTYRTKRNRTNVWGPFRSRHTNETLNSPESAWREAA